MEKDLFGDKIAKPRKTKFERVLNQYDRQTLSSRIERLKYIDKIFPKGFLLATDPPTFYIFQEAKMTFINGHFISTILLSQAFIERKLQMYYQAIGAGKIAKKGIKAIIDHAMRNKTIHGFLLMKLDELRKIRNPFVHLKEHEHEYNLTQRIFNNMQAGNNFKNPEQILYEDARNSISLMYAFFATPLN